MEKIAGRRAARHESEGGVGGGLGGLGGLVGESTGQIMGSRFLIL